MSASRKDDFKALALGVYDFTEWLAGKTRPKTGQNGEIRQYLAKFQTSLNMHLTKFSVER